eukprot:3884305-Amphidinium_carterae.5
MDREEAEGLKRSAAGSTSNEPLPKRTEREEAGGRESEEAPERGYLDAMPYEVEGAQLSDKDQTYRPTALRPVGPVYGLHFHQLCR